MAIRGGAASSFASSGSEAIMSRRSMSGGPPVNLSERLEMEEAAEAERMRRLRARNPGNGSGSGEPEVGSAVSAHENLGTSGSTNSMNGFH